MSGLGRFFLAVCLEQDLQLQKNVQFLGQVHVGSFPFLAFPDQAPKESFEERGSREVVGLVT
jgi:hypothetical protein